MFQPAKSGVADPTRIDLSNTDSLGWRMEFLLEITLSTFRLKKRNDFKTDTDDRSPGSWNDWVPPGELKRIGGAGFATYFLLLKLNPNRKGRLLTLKIPYAGTAYKVWVDDQLLTERFPKISRQWSQNISIIRKDFS
ncbi:hypothetical protein A0128_10485 [Leptospira tipperaryensis]|uniref:Uncharacterized protein n=1 Tax=Leptospira tipperaryensis TaxID=2564040 RepID=A0A1D7UXF5_9LEPT|nr:hypothetical protein [Leptospira tipperaryensis]AOP34235.1 hypothetical protein A0128_10485 [Leptospira tipperaryensis]